MTRNAPSESGALSSSGIGTGPPNGSPLTSSAGCPGSAAGKGPRVLIRDQRRRWGSCARDGTLRFSWRAMMLEPALIDYVVVHELAHLTHQNHSADFWDLVRSAMPDADDRRRRLREAGRSLPL